MTRGRLCGVPSPDPSRLPCDRIELHLGVHNHEMRECIAAGHDFAVETVVLRRGGPPVPSAVECRRCGAAWDIDLR